MAISFPALKPNSRTFDVGQYPVAEGRFRDGWSYPRLLGSQPFDAQLSLTYRHLSDNLAALLINCYRSSVSGFHPLALPPEVVAGIDDTDLATRIQLAGPMEWRWIEPPSIESIVPGISTVQVRLGGSLELVFATSAATSGDALGVRWGISASFSGGGATFGAVAPGATWELTTDIASYSAPAAAWPITASFTADPAFDSFPPTVVTNAAWDLTASFTGDPAVAINDITTPAPTWDLTATFAGADGNAPAPTWDLTASFTGAAASVGAATDPYFSSVSLLLQMNGSNGSTTFTDSSSNALTVTAYGNAKISTTESQWGGSSLELDGTGDYLRVPPSTGLTLTGNFTIETWVRMRSYARMFLASSAESTQNNIQVFALNDVGKQGVIQVYMDNLSGTLGKIIESSTGVLVTDTWHHLALTRSGTNGKLFVDGVQVGSTYASWSASFRCDVVGTLFTSGTKFNGFDFDGYVNGFRVTKGVARYTANFTRPTAAFPDS